MNLVSSRLFFMQKTRHERCPECGSKDVIKWGKQSGHQMETDHQTGVRDKRIQRTSPHMD